MRNELKWKVLEGYRSFVLWLAAEEAGFGPVVAQKKEAAQKAE